MVDVHIGAGLPKTNIVYLDFSTDTSYQTQFFLVGKTRLCFKVGLSGRGVLEVPSLSSSLMLILSYFTLCGGVQLMQLLMMCCGICGMLFLEIRMKIILWCGKNALKDIKNLPPYFESLWPGMREHVNFISRKAPMRRNQRTFGGA
jgi:hypothetical protein